MVILQIDVLVNNGGRSQRSLYIDTDIDVYGGLMELNYLGTISITQHVLRHMIHHGDGVIATISSIAGLAGVPLSTGYSASKHALQVRAVDRSADLQENNETVCVCVFISSCVFSEGFL